MAQFGRVSIKAGQIFVSASNTDLQVFMGIVKALPSGNGTQRLPPNMRASFSKRVHGDLLIVQIRYHYRKRKFHNIQHAFEDELTNIYKR